MLMLIELIEMLNFIDMLNSFIDMLNSLLGCYFDNTFWLRKFLHHGFRRIVALIGVKISFDHSTYFLF